MPILLELDVRERDLHAALEALFLANSGLFVENPGFIQLKMCQLPLGDAIISWIDTVPTEFLQNTAINSPKQKSKATKKVSVATTSTIASNPLEKSICILERKNLVLFERKTMPDLFASLRDGRYEEQAYRLNGVSEWNNHNVVYLLEGSTVRMTAQERTTFFSCIFSLEFFKGFSTVRTADVAESAFYLFNSMRRLSKNMKEVKYPFYGFYPNKLIGLVSDSTKDVVESLSIENNASTIIKEDVLPSTSVSYMSVVKKVKKDNITPANINEYMLITIPGISSTTSAAIMRHYGTLENMLHQLRINGLDDLKNVSLTNATIKELNSKKRTAPTKLNKLVIANIGRYLLSSDNTNSTIEVANTGEFVNCESESEIE